MKPSVCTLTENEDKDGLELRFPGPISEVWSGVLRQNNWRFAPMKWKDPLWYCKRNPESFAFAQRVVKKYNAMLAAPNVVIEARPPTVANPICPTFK